jgi:hypothetical protein
VLAVFCNEGGGNIPPCGIRHNIITVDTRTKIVGSDRVAQLAAEGAQVVSGHFDPLVSSLAEQLAELKNAGPGAPLVILIRSSNNPILPARARAELVAALAVVDYVCDAESSIEPAHQLDSSHEQRLKQLITHVHGRQKAGGKGTQS